MVNKKIRKIIFIKKFKKRNQALDRHKKSSKQTKGSMSFVKVITKIVVKTQLKNDGKGERLVLFERDFDVDEITGVTRLGLKFSITFETKKFFQYGYPEGKIKILEGIDSLNLNGRVHLQIDYWSGDEKGTIFFKQRVDKLREDFYFQTNPLSVDQNRIDFTPEDREIFLGIIGNPEKSGIEKEVNYTVTLNIFPKKKELPAGLGLARKLGGLLMNGELSDVKLSCNGQIFNCHKVVLCCNSEAFKTMLLNNSMESSIGEIELTETSASVVEALLHFIYNNIIEKSKISTALLAAAHKYMVTDLIKICVDFLAENLTGENAVEVMTTAYATNQKELLRKASKILFKNQLAGQTFETAAWNEMKEKDPDLALTMIDEVLFRF